MSCEPTLESYKKSRLPQHNFGCVSLWVYVIDPRVLSVCLSYIINRRSHSVLLLVSLCVCVGGIITVIISSSNFPCRIFTHYHPHHRKLKTIHRPFLCVCGASRCAFVACCVLQCSHLDRKISWSSCVCEETGGTIEV